jgi:5-methyltetrahydropteroyltriglutamate--homocysteine methyltransferase
VLRQTEHSVDSPIPECITFRCNQQLEQQDELVRRIEAATQYVPLERLALSARCGFASVDQGNQISFAAQQAKMELVAPTADRVWGSA